MRLLPPIACLLLPLVLVLPTRAANLVPDPALAAAVRAERARPAAPALTRAGFLAPPVLSAVALSPQGDAVAYLREQGGARGLWLLATAGGPARPLLARSPATQLFWSSDGRWLFLRAGDSLATVTRDGHAGVRIPMGGSERRQAIKLDPSQPAAVLLRERVRVGTGLRWRIVRMDVAGRRTVLHEDERWIEDVAVDARGRLVAMVRFDGDENVLLRLSPDGRWRQALRVQPMQRAALLAAQADGSLLLDGDVGGNLRRLVRLDPNDRLQTVHEDPRHQADLDEVALDPTTKQPLVASYRSAEAASYGLGAARATVAALQARLPGRDLALQAPGAADAPWLVAERAATLREPRWYLYDPRRDELRPILSSAPTGDVGRQPPEAALARKVAIAYRASDGRTLYGFVLLPPGVDVARAPLVAQVHGGPIDHFRNGYDGVAQFLASRGYVVFQSNFRGSTGFGRNYTLAARGDFGNGRVQQDIVEGVRWLLAQGIGDARRVGIVGHSFGGYSALLGATFQPDLFRVAVAGAPPADFGWSMRWLLDAGDQGARPDRSLLRTLRALSADPTDPAARARLREQSPQANAARLRQPLLIMAGGADRTVPIREVTHYVATLRALGRPASLLVEPGGGHSPTEPLPREAYLYAMAVMLQAHLGGPAPEPPGPRLQAYLRANLRQAGPEFAKVAPVRIVVP